MQWPTNSEIQSVVPGLYLLLCLLCNWFIVDLIAVMSYAMLISPIPSIIPGGSRCLCVQIWSVVNIAIGDQGAIWIANCQISVLEGPGSFFRLYFNQYCVSYNYHGRIGTQIACKHLNLVSNWSHSHPTLYHSMQYIFTYYPGELFYCSACYCLLFEYSRHKIKVERVCNAKRFYFVYV